MSDDKDDDKEIVLSEISDEEAPKITFPCDYPIKVMGEDVNGYSEAIIAIVRSHAPDLKDDNISFRPSRNGRYLAVNVTITATGTDQLQALFDELKASGRVAMVL